MEDKVAGATVRLVCRYPNGLVKGYVARGVSMEGEVLLVRTADSFEEGINLSAMAAFLPRTRTGRVISVKRDEQPGYYLLEMSLQPLPTVVRVPPPPKVDVAAKEAMSQYATRLARCLEAAGKQPFRIAAFERATVREKEGFVAATAAAVFLLLVQKNQVDGAKVLESLRRSK